MIVLKKIYLIILLILLQSIIVKSEIKIYCKDEIFSKWDNCFGKAYIAYDEKKGWGGPNPSNIFGTYTGSWSKGQPHGKGQMLIDDNDLYIGEFKFGKQNGYVEAFYNDGRIFKGDWKDGLKEGNGVFTYPDGKIIEGIFKKNKLKIKTN